MSKIAQEVGITAGGLYRHFEDKAAVLEQVFEHSFEWLDRPLSPGRLFDVVDEAIGVLVDQPYVADLWFSERRNLSAESNTVLVARMDRWRKSIADAFYEMCPHLSATQMELLLAATQSALFCLGRRTLRVPPAEQIKAVRSAIQGIASTRLTAFPGEPEQVVRRRMPVSLRERILIAASDHFGRGEGYHATAMSTIGATAGVTGPSLYLHFRNKAEILRAVHEREVHALWIELDATLATVTDAAEALAVQLESWVRVIQPGVATLDARDGETLGSFGTSIAAQSEYVAELVALLLEAKPELTTIEARARVQIGLIIVADLLRDPDVSAQSSLHHDATALVVNVVGVRPAVGGQRPPTAGRP
jgi:AcrR family transcriptional regulator